MSCLGKTKKSQKNKTTADKQEHLDDLMSKIQNINLEDIAPTVALSNDNCNNDWSGKTLDNSSSAEERQSERKQEVAMYYEVEDTSLIVPLTDYTQSSECKEYATDDELQISDCKVKGVQSRADFICTISNNEQADAVAGEMDQVGTEENIVGCKNVSCNIFCSPNFNFPTRDGFCKDVFHTPSENETTSLNLVDITLDQTMGADLGAIDDLLTDSFVASLQDLTPIHGGPHMSATKSSSKLLSSRQGDHDVSFESNTVLNEGLSSDFENEVYCNSFQQPSNAPKDVGRQELSNEYVEVIGKRDIGEVQPEVPNCLTSSSQTPDSREQTSLASRLLMRFQTENRANNIADKLLSISGEGELAHMQ